MRGEIVDSVDGILLSKTYTTGKICAGYVP